jgi:hypothetical protein
MNGNNILVDTNIILYLLSGDKTLIPILNNKNLFVSFITQLELLSYSELNNKQIAAIKKFLLECTIIDINPDIKNFTINLRKKFSLKLPDAIIAATAMYLNLPLISADSQFSKVTDVDLIFYKKD